MNGRPGFFWGEQGAARWVDGKVRPSMKRGAREVVVEGKVEGKVERGGGGGSLGRK